jgi:apolipoprotein N-acyltransferase
MPQIARRPLPESYPAVAPARRGIGWSCVLASLVSAALMWLCYFPMACGWLGWIALIPWLMLVRADLPRRRRYLFAWLGGMIFFVPALEWMRAGDTGMVYLWLMLALYCSWYWVAALWLIRRFGQRTGLPLTVTVPLVWTGLDFARGELMGGFAFYLLGQTQQAVLPVIQIADLGGVAAVTILVAMVNGLLAESADRLPAIRGWFGLPAPVGRPSLRPQAVACAAVLALALGYGGWRLYQADFVTGPWVALLQTSIPQTERNAASVAAAGDPLARASIEEQTARLTKQAVSGSERADLIIWPETTFPWERKEFTPGAPERPELAEWRKDIAAREEITRERAQFSGTNVLLGLNACVVGLDGKTRRYNSALLLTPRGDSVGRYDKMHLLPFGEFLPFKDSLPFMKYLSPYPYDYSLASGEAQTRFPLSAAGKEYHFGVLICYEDSDASLARGLVRPGLQPPVDFLVNITNDGWFMGTAEHAEHLAVSRFRAVETRRPLLRAVNGGISAVVDGNGRIVALPGPTWAASQAVTGLISAAVPLDTRTSLYARLGDWLPMSCWGVILVGCLRRPKLTGIS